MFPNQQPGPMPGQPQPTPQPTQQPTPIQPLPAQQFPQPSYASPPNYSGNQPDKKMIIIGGIVVVVIIAIAGMLLFSGGGNKSDATAWNNLTTSETQIPLIVRNSRQDISMQALQNAAATAQITWTSNSADDQKLAQSVLGSKSAPKPPTAINPRTKTTLQTAKDAGNLDPALTKALIDQLNQINQSINAILLTNPSSKTKAQLKQTQDLAQNTLKQLQSLSSASSDQ